MFRHTTASPTTSGRIRKIPAGLASTQPAFNDDVVDHIVDDYEFDESK